MNKNASFNISSTKVEALLLEHYGIEGKASELPGEKDLNFRIQSEKDRFILKLAPIDSNPNFLEYQSDLLNHLSFKSEVIAPMIVANKASKQHAIVQSDDGPEFQLRLLTWISGRLWSQVNPHTDNLRFDLGKTCGQLTSSLQDFDHKEAHRYFDWDIAQSLWTKKHSHLFTLEQNRILSYFQNRFEAHFTAYSSLRTSVVHNDANDNNIIVSEDLIQPEVVAIIDFGDTIHTQLINDVAIACAYAIMNTADPLMAALPVVKGYHECFPLEESELLHLYNCIAMRLVISVTKAAINKKEHPENDYLIISEQSAWELLHKWKAISPDLAHFAFRHACNFPAHPDREKFNTWAHQHSFSLAELFPTIQSNSALLLDLSVSSTWIGHQSEFNDLDLFQYKIEKLQAENPGKIIAGGYLEPRPLYTSTEYDKDGNNGKESRTLHLGVDFWLAHKTPVHALLDGEVVLAVNDAGNKEYGGLVILKHCIDHLIFYTLYGHLTIESALKNEVGKLIKKGELIAVLGNYPENGNWAPHLHFQIMLSMLNYKNDFPGVTYLSQVDLWKDLCPDPNLLFKSEGLFPRQNKSNTELLEFRNNHLGKGMSLHYNKPIKMVRGSAVYLMDQFGQKYLDTINNVAHVGHEHPDVVKAGQNQMALLNTNTRYLHENINILAQELMESLPPELCVFHFVNSGSEANELALRMAKTCTGQKDFIASEMGYHGNTNMCIDISSYKFDGKGGTGAPEHTHIFPIPDTFRGQFVDANASENYANEVVKCIDSIHKKGRKVAAFIIEPIISCGGQIEIPKGFLTQVYEKVREAGGLCISDEVQTGCGRMGKTFWGFQLHDVTPDIITIGKPIGNGHPLAAVVCTKAVAHKFANGMEYFNTFGGNPVSCAIATEVLRIIKREDLQNNALKVGDFLKNGLKSLAIEFPILGDIRGQGLFLGMELVDRNLQPLPKHASYMINRMKDYGILMSIDGPDHNVLKIKPPMIFSMENAEDLLYYLKLVLSEDFMKSF